MDWSVLTPKQVDRIRNWQLGVETHTRHVRETIKRTLAEQAVDFNQLASEQWEKMLKNPCVAILAA